MLIAGIFLSFVLVLEEEQEGTVINQQVFAQIGNPQLQTPYKQMKLTTRLERQNPLEVLNEAWTIAGTAVGRYSVICNSATNILQCQLQIMVNLIVESYKDSTVNSILDDIARKYKIDTSKEHLSEDIHFQEVKFKYRTYGECIRILYKNIGYKQKA